ncbi:MAG: hypothetical protein JWM11_1183 [Planctomycetaceae bacterium]|nr:hypothetical protein [Planctomycetaceae bacterium]
MLPITRRAVLKSCALTVGGSGLANLLRMRAEAGNGLSRPTSVIFVTMGGGPSQFETFDPKPEAPAEYRGAFQSIATNVTGVQFCELLPRLARLADRIAVIRSIHHEQASHIAEHIVETGFDLRNFASTRNGDMPSIGSIVSRLRGVGPSGIPSYVSLPRHHAYSSPHWIGAQHHFFAVDSDPNSETFAVNNLALTGGLNRERLHERKRLQSAFGANRTVADRTGDAAAIDVFSKQAFDLITGERAQRAFNIQAEDPRIRDRYGRNDFGQRLLLARRLVEADVPFITVRTFDWDDHDKIAERMKVRSPIFDTGVSALIEDLRDRGLDRDVLIVTMGEFGRTPRVNQNAGRDHFPAVNSVMLSGGSYRMGQIIGATDRTASQVTAAPYRPQNVLTMVYRHLGIDPATAFNDYSGRPRHILEERGLIAELI